MSMDVKVSSSGPLFDGRAAADLDQGLDDWKKNIATIGASMVRSDMDAHFKVQRPYYRLTVTASATPPDWKISDHGSAIYNYWLEGIGSRNFPKTRFRGYSSFRRMTQAINARAVSIGQPIIAKWVAKINGA